ncbi:hypothetical protein [Paraburkholderia acidisoli]|uniref:hypothetical protein n=1 Tax=Paraburkholderia acidisoli TaxID=2571748 RepID=UPI001E4A3D74|nr:hypothetical protein [Paraburkholderia acidisoli]
MLIAVLIRTMGLRERRRGRAQHGYENAARNRLSIHRYPRDGQLQVSVDRYRAGLVVSACRSEPLA